VAPNTKSPPLKRQDKQDLRCVASKKPSTSRSINSTNPKLGAWSTSEQGKRIQAIAMGIVHNLLSLFEAKLKSEEGIEDTKVIKAWQKDLTKWAEKARAAGRHLDYL
jgi:hypothetical protein